MPNLHSPGPQACGWAHLPATTRKGRFGYSSVAASAASFAANMRLQLCVRRRCAAGCPLLPAKEHKVICSSSPRPTIRSESSARGPQVRPDVCLRAVHRRSRSSLKAGGADPRLKQRQEDYRKDPQGPRTEGSPPTCGEQGLLTTRMPSRTERILSPREQPASKKGGDCRPCGQRPSWGHPALVANGWFLGTRLPKVAVEVARKTTEPN